MILLSIPYFILNTTFRKESHAGVAIIANQSLTATHVQRLMDFYIPIAEPGVLENVYLNIRYHLKLY